MAEAIVGLLERIDGPPRLLIERIGGPRRLLMVLIGLGAVALIWGISYWATAPSWVPLFQGLELRDAGAVATQLDEAGIEHRLDRDGSLVLVREDELARARVLLAQAGVPAAGRPGFELFDQPSWGMTDFTQRVNYRRALEGELERTIRKMQGVEGAEVHLALNEASVFRRAQDRPLEASVVLRLRPGVRASSELVEGVAFLVASSVDGLQSENVTVLDDAGRVLSVPAEAEGGADAAAAQAEGRGGALPRDEGGGTAGARGRPRERAGAGGCDAGPGPGRPDDGVAGSGRTGRDAGSAVRDRAGAGRPGCGPGGDRN